MLNSTESLRWRRVKKILDHVADVPAKERQAALESTCGDDRDLLEEVRSFLELEDEATDFITSPLWRAIPDEEESICGHRLGPYRLERQLGQGGMGTVYLAVREDDYEQKVAIKRTLGPALSERSLSRFLNERQILANLRHPGIARLLDGGADEEGRPYLVMDYVEGPQIDHYCEENDLSLRQRLRLVSKVCRIVHHAHKNLVVHRDLKPSNILVQRDGQPRLLDFGIAKLVHSDTALTAQGAAAMTPACASPEQIMGEVLDGRADVMQKIDGEYLERNADSDSHDIRSQRSQEVFYVHLNPANPPFDDRRVRCAVDLAIDRDALAESLLDGHAQSAGQMVGAGSFGYSPKIEATQADRAKARQLLKDAGHAEGATLILYHPSSAENVAAVLRDHLEEIGVQVVLRGLVWHEFFDLLQPTQLPAYLAGWSESTFDAASVFESLVHSKDPERGFGDINFTGYSRPTIDRQIDRAAREMDPEARRRLLEKISEEVRKDCAFLPLVWPLEHYGVSVEIEWTPRLDGLLRAVEMKRRYDHSR